jgi:sensor histidine kinase YesM
MSLNHIKILICNILIICVLHFNIKAQTSPIYQIIQKKDGLQSNTIYNLHIAKSGLLYIAHNKGLSSYDGLVFKHYPNSKYPFTELTNIMETENGNIISKAFNNAMYILKGDSMRPYDHHLHKAGFHASAVYKNNIISIATDSIIINNVQHNTRITKPIGYLKNTINPKSTIIFMALWEQNGQLKLVAVDDQFNIGTLNKEMKSFNKVHNSIGKYFFCNSKDLKNIFQFPENSTININDIDATSLLNYVSVTDSFTFICTSKGLYYYNNNQGSKHIQYILENYNITAVVQTNQNSLFVSTLSNGLIYIPSFKVNALKNLLGNTNSIYANNDMLLTSTKQGQLRQYNWTNNTIQSLGQFSSALTFMLPDTVSKKLILCSENRLVPLANTINLRNLAVKDYCYMQGYLILATNNGMFVYSEKPITNWLKKYLLAYPNPVNNLYRLNFFDEYVATVKYSASIDKFYINTYAGIFEMDNTKAKPLILPEPYCALKDMCIWQGKLLLATKDKGILEWTGKEYVKAFSSMNINGILLKFEIYNNELWIQGEDAIYKIQNQKLSTYNNANGIPVSDISQIAINDNSVFASTSDEVIQFYKDIANAQIYPPKVLLHAVRNKSLGQLIKDGEDFKYFNNNIVIDFSLIDYFNGANTHLAYSINNQELLHLSEESRNIQLNNLAPANYTIELFVVSNNIKYAKAAHLIRFSISPPFYSTWWFTALLIMASMVLVYAIAIVILNRWKKEALAKEAKLLLEKELDKSMLTSIKAQMNPHFIFNALNTIQSFIYSNEKQQAGMYISKFSDLTRRILEISAKDNISLAEEISVLKLYLELEKMRFEDSFEYVLDIDSQLQLESFHIPSMLIQPYVENAIKHGLLHKKTNRKLLVSFTKNEKGVAIVVQDNGVGRIKSAELNAIKNRQHQSFATIANKKRIDLLKSTNPDIGIDIFDLHSELGEVSGTKVVIQLPFL